MSSRILSTFFLLTSCFSSSLINSGLSKRGSKTTIKADKELEAKLTDDQAMKAMEQCPVGAILKKEVGFVVPIGERKYDKTPIGSDIG